MVKNTKSVLPGWDLSALYRSIDDPAILRDLDRVDSLTKKFSGDFAGRISTLSGSELLSAIRAAEEISSLSATLFSFVFLHKSIDQLDPHVSTVNQSINEKLTEFGKCSRFFELEINDIADFASIYASESGLLKYKPWIDHVRRFRQHQLPLEIENVLSDKNLVASDAWCKLFFEIHADLSYDVRGEKHTCAEVTLMLSESDATLRRDAAKAISTTMNSNQRVFAHIFNNIIKDKSIDDSLRGFARPISSRNLKNFISDETIDLLLSSVKSNYVNIAHRYYKLKAKILGKNTLDYWDRNAPLFADAGEYCWNEARDIVLQTFMDFSPKMGAMCEEFFIRNLVDVPPRTAKDSGAFCCPVRPDTAPYILLNFQGKLSDVYTLAHELGHGVHYMLASDNTPFLYEVPLTFAETASIFAERLVFKALLERETTPKGRALLISNIVEGMVNSIIRQTAFCEFETVLHQKRSESSLTSSAICDAWISTQARSLGPSVDLGSGYEYYWSLVPHFVHAPFYVYSYAFGACLVNSLYVEYDRDKIGFRSKYENMLAAGGAVSVDMLQESFGFNLNSAAFWQKGLDVISGLIDELEICCRNL